MRTLGIDYGEKRIGLAVSDPLGLTAQAVAMVGKGKTFADDVREIKKIIKKYEGMDEVVVGLPRMMSGEIGIQADKVLEFVEALKKAFKIPIITWDERLTTVQAQRFLIEAGVKTRRNKGLVDQSAATFILQSYMDSRKK